ncbi:MAG: hypothetical protein ACUVX8_05920, partial [Candidatus Zipacnadales bacterium]
MQTRTHSWTGLAPVNVVFAVALTLLSIHVGCGDRRISYNRATVALTGEALLQRYSWLTETSKYWGQKVDLAAEEPLGYSDLGCFPLGNGRVFTTSGLRYPFGTMANIFGPTYQKRHGSLGTQEVVVLQGEAPVELPQQEVAWVMRSGVVHTRLRNVTGLQLDIYDCIPPQGYSICRVLVLTNNSSHSVKGVKLAIAQVAGALEPHKGQLVANRPPRWVRIGFVGAQTETTAGYISMPLPDAARALSRMTASEAGGTVTCALGTLKPGESLAKVGYTVIAPSAEIADREVARLEQAGFGVLEETRAWWQKWYADALTLQTPDERINEFIPIQQHIVRVQQAESGGYSPMYMYTTCWVRDSNGPVRFMSQSGKFGEVRKYLDYYYACSAQRGQVPMNFPLDLPLTKPLPQIDWAQAKVERAEVPSFIILQHYWYWKHSGDWEPIKKHWEYLRRNLLGQQIDEQGRLPFHGDETYRFPGYSIFEQTQKEPADWVSMDLMSADSAWDFVVAAQAMRQWAQMLGWSDQAAEFAALGDKVRRALDRLYWMPDRRYYAPAMSDFSGELYRYPFANIHLSPQWLAPDPRWWENWAGMSDTRLCEAILRPLEWLWKKSGTIQTTPGCGYYVGMTPGMVVWNLALMGHPSLDAAVRGMLKAAEPSGGYSEMVTPEDKPADQYWGKNRVRPWEGGLNAEALVLALTRLQVDAPQHLVTLDPPLRPLIIRNLRCGGSVLHATCKPVDERLIVELEVEGKHTLGVRLPPMRGTVSLKPGEKRTVAIRRPVSLSSLKPFKPPSQPFQYGPPTFAGKARTIVVTWSRETFAAYRNQPSPAAIDTKIAFPPAYLAAALYSPNGKQRRADTL